MILWIATALISLNPLASAANAGPHIEPGPVQEITEGHRLVRALLANPQIGDTLRAKHLLDVSKITQQALAPGITHYFLEVSTCGNCMPGKGTVFISEDQRPEWADGDPTYKVKVTTD